MNKYWKQITRKEYVLMTNEARVATLHMTKHGQAEIYTNEQQYCIIRKKSWFRSFRVLDAQGNIVAEASPKKWYSESLLFQYQQQVYLIKHRNNPLFEVVLQNLQKQDIIAYGKGIENLKEKIKVTDHRQGSNTTDYLPDAIVWFLFQSAPELDVMDFI
ncbi:hypothetical protein BKI52_23855 [marine bacterium AO1-C]|nr:hypothetical protein BKI52_23855 [marine bacterium AO1-C]